jgi:L-ascorbate metabolism protein UlaG (beta-lactamase superfamily)
VRIADEALTPQAVVHEPSRLTWIGHSTVLIELDGTRILTDPVLRDRLAVLRRVAPLADADVRDVDAILVSHVHYDHLDLPSLRRFARSTPLVVPDGAGRHVRSLRFTNVREIACGEQVRLGPLTIRSTFADHEARRRPLGRLVPSLGYLVAGSGTVYFAGDTDLFDGMVDIASDLDIALLPIAGWGPRIPAGHMDPLRAAQAVTRLKPRLAVPIHWGTYRRFDLRADDASVREPATVFARRVEELAPDVAVSIVPPGGTVEIPPRPPRPEGGP